jgi:hypothetical protein
LVRDPVRDGVHDSSDPALHAAFEAANGIQLGLDVAWDLFLCLGTVLLAANMWNHPRFGRFYAVSGCVIAVALVVANLTVFPEPPGDAGSIDLGPVIGLWYLVVTTRLAMSRGWAAAPGGARPVMRSARLTTDHVEHIGRVHSRGVRYFLTQPRHPRRTLRRPATTARVLATQAATESRDVTSPTDRPDERHFTSCGATLGGCDSRRLFSERPCCSACSHPPTEPRNPT